MIDLQEWLKTVEWYDNHTISTVLACPRKAFWHKVYRGGLTAGVGHGANFGTCIHAGQAAYYDKRTWGIKTERERRYDALRAFAREYVKLFGSETPLLYPAEGGIDKKHTLQNGLEILNDYFDNYLFDDPNWRPIETEMTGIFRFEEREGDPVEFEPFYYLIRTDGMWEQVSSGDLYVREIKTTGGGVKRELTRLRINRQTTGYATIAKEFPGGDKVAGVLYDVIGVFVGKREYGRDVVGKPQSVCDSWRHQTIRIVQEYRWRLSEIEKQPLQFALDMFYQNDQECTKYGLCPFWAGCFHGPALLDDLEPNTWTPLSIAKDDGAI